MHEPVGEDDAERAVGGGHRRAHQPRRLGHERRELLGHLAAEIADHLDHPVLADGLRGDRRRLDGHVGARERLDVHAVGARPRARAGRRES